MVKCSFLIARNIFLFITGSVTTLDEIMGLFYKLKQLFKNELQKKGHTPGQVVDALLKLQADNEEHNPFLDGDSYFGELCQASDNSELLGQLSFNMDHLSCDLLDALVENLYLENLKPEIKVYKSHLSNFLNNTLLSQFFQRRKTRLHPHFQEVVARVEWRDDMKFGDVEQFRQKYMAHHKLKEYSMMFAYASKFLVTWFIPQSVTKMLQRNVPKDLLKSWRVNKLQVGGECVYRVEFRVGLSPLPW